MATDTKDIRAENHVRPKSAADSIRPRQMREPDEAVILACQQRDRAAQRQLFDVYSQQVFRLLHRTIGPRRAAELTRQIFLSVFEKIEQYAGTSPFRTWLYRIAIDEARHFIRRGTRENPTVLSRDPMNKLLASPSSAGDGDLLECALARLDFDSRAIFLLREVEALTYHDLAIVLNISEESVGSRLNRARRELVNNLSNIA